MSADNDRARAERVRLGSWRCPSGNSVDVFFRHDPYSARLGHLLFEWDSPPPLAHPRDRAYYLDVIFPAVVELARPHLEVPGRRVVVVG